MIGAAPAKINLALVVGPVRDDGKHEVVTVFQRLDLCDRISVEPAPETTVDGFAEDTIVRRALDGLAAPHGWRIRIEKRIPVAAGLAGGSSDAATALRLANAQLEQPLEPAALSELAARIGADVPFFLADGPQLGTGDGTQLEPVALPQDFVVLLLLPKGERKHSTAAVYEAFDRRGGEDGFAERAARPAGGARRHAPAARPRAAASERPRELAARGGATRARSLPRRRQRSGAGCLRALPPAGRRRGR